MSFKKTNLSEIPQEFLINNITPFMCEKLQLRYYIKNRVEEIRKKEKIPLMHIYTIISEEVSMQEGTVKQIHLSTKS